MSSAKLKLLFKQIFGNSIFNCYQEFRMKEAALLLKEEKLSVSDVGYQLNFSKEALTTSIGFANIFVKLIETPTKINPVNAADAPATAMYKSFHSCIATKILYFIVNSSKIKSIEGAGAAIGC